MVKPDHAVALASTTRRKPLDLPHQPGRASRRSRFAARFLDSPARTRHGTTAASTAISPSSASASRHRPCGRSSRTPASNRTQPIVRLVDDVPGQPSRRDHGV
jgi:hypothetical protein